MAKWVLTKNLVPHRLQSFACWPMGDSVFGLWITQIAQARSTRITLVHTPIRIQHFPWPSWHFSNSSIVMHGLKGGCEANGKGGCTPNDKGTIEFRRSAQAHGTGPFVAWPRECDTCERMGWSTYPGSHLNRWRCCGQRTKEAKKAFKQHVQARKLEAKRMQTEPPGVSKLDPKPAFLMVSLSFDSQVEGACDGVARHQDARDAPRRAKPTLTRCV